MNERTDIFIQSIHIDVMRIEMKSCDRKSLVITQVNFFTECNIITLDQIVCSVSQF